MFGSVFKNSAINKEYRFVELTSKYINSFSTINKNFLPKGPEDAPSPYFSIGTNRNLGVANSYQDIYPSLPAYLSLLAYNDFISFVTQYYDWLYTENRVDTEGFGSGLFLTKEDIFRLIDIDRIAKTSADDTDYIKDPSIRKEILDLIAAQYAEGLETYYSDPANPITEEDLTNFISGIRENFYQKKTNLSALQYYFETLFNVTGAQVLVDYPKRYMLRTDGGVPDFAPENSAEHILLSNPVLNEAVLQDSYWYQDYSYLISVQTISEDSEIIQYDINDVEQQIYKELAHPAGIKVFFNVTNDDYIPPPDFDGEFGAREQTILGNYLPYRVTDFNGITYTAGCTYDLDGDGLGKPTFNHPGWSDNIPAEGSVAGSFGNINIGRFFFLEPADNSPNTAFPECS